MSRCGKQQLPSSRGASRCEVRLTAAGVVSRRGKLTISATRAFAPMVAYKRLTIAELAVLVPFSPLELASAAVAADSEEPAWAGAWVEEPASAEEQALVGESVLVEAKASLLQVGLHGDFPA
jgi:hypothetical protein